MAGRIGRRIGLFLAGVVALVGCGRTPQGPPPGAPEGAPGTVLILVLSGTAANGDVARAVEEALASDPDTAIFGRHYAASPDTAGAIAATFSGFPGASIAPEAPSPGAGSGAGESARASLPRPVLAEMFSRMGYATFAVVSDPALAPQLGYARGFEHYAVRPELSPAEQRELVRRQLDGARGPVFAFVQVAASDRAAAVEWLDLVRGLDRFPETLLVVTSDHGAIAGGQQSVEERFREAAVRIPCIVKFPKGRRPETVPARSISLTSAVDLLPSLLALVGRDISEALPGSKIFEGYFTDHALVEAGDAWAFVQDNHKLVVEGPRSMLFDLAADPQEQRDVAGDLPEQAAALLASATEARAALAAGPGPGTQSEEGLDEETLEHLRSLGYIQ